MNKCFGWIHDNSFKNNQLINHGFWEEYSFQFSSRNRFHFFECFFPTWNDITRDIIIWFQHESGVGLGVDINLVSRQQQILSRLPVPLAKSVTSNLTMTINRQTSIFDILFSNVSELDILGEFSNVPSFESWNEKFTDVPPRYDTMEHRDWCGCLTKTELRNPVVGRRVQIPWRQTGIMTSCVTTSYA